MISKNSLKIVGMYLDGGFSFEKNVEKRPFYRAAILSDWGNTAVFAQRNFPDSPHTMKNGGLNLYPDIVDPVSIVPNIKRFNL